MRGHYALILDMIFAYSRKHKGTNKHVNLFLRGKRRPRLSDQRIVAEGAGELGQEANFCRVPTEVSRIRNPHLTHIPLEPQELFS